MKTELNEQDRERIEQEAKLYAKNHSAAPDKETPDWIITDFCGGAEYATIYERAECDKIIGRATEDQADTIVMLDQKVKSLEAERSEVVSLLKEFANDTGAVDTNLKARVKMYLAEHKL